MRPTARAAAAAIAVALLAPRPASAESSVDQAKALFEGGATMYDRGHYVDAIQAFEAAYRLAPRAGILFSAAQAHRKQFFFDKDPAQLRKALAGYREYVEKTPSGGRRAEAISAIAELEPYTSRVDMSKATEGPERKQTRIMVQSAAHDVEATVDGQRSTDDALRWVVKPGKHVVRASAPGFAPQEREVSVPEGEYESVYFNLKELPARLSVEAIPGAVISIDGRPTAVTPLPRPLDVEPGSHLVTVAKNGFKGYREEIEVHHGEARTLTAKLGRSGQRIAAYVMFGTAGAAAVVGGVFAALAVEEQSTAQGIDDKRKTVTISGDELTSYNTALSNRDADRRVAGIALGGAVAVGAAGLVAYVFDQPSFGGDVGQRRDDRPKKPDATPLTPRAPRELDISLAPTWSPGAAGGVLRGRF